MKVYTSKSKGGQYELLGVSKGAGKLKGERRVVYRCMDSGHIYHRIHEDFHDRMLEVKYDRLMLTHLSE